MKATIVGNQKIAGNIKVGGAKNAALPILAAILVNSSGVILRRLPDLADVSEMINLLLKSGVKVAREKDAASFSYTDLTGDLFGIFSKIRASILLLGPLTLKTGKAILPYPGGCSIGKRPIDIHINGLKELGLSVKVGESFISSKISNIPKESQIKLPFPSVGATEHLMITASMMKGTTTYISNCAMEPEVVELQRFLNSMGANVQGAGSSKIKIEGVSKFNGSDFEIMGDRIEAGTYIILGLLTQGNLCIEGIEKEYLNYLPFFRKIGGKIKTEKSKLFVAPSKIGAFKVETAPYPGFPTDLQPQMTALACKAEGVSIITENIFENRFRHVEELKKMGVNIERNGRTMKIIGPQRFQGAYVVGSDLRETAAITLAAVAADGSSTIENFDILFRGYENIVEKLRAIGVKITL